MYTLTDKNNFLPLVKSIMQTEKNLQMILIKMFSYSLGMYNIKKENQAREDLKNKTTQCGRLCQSYHIHLVDVVRGGGEWRAKPEHIANKGLTFHHLLRRMKGGEISREGGKN